MHGYIADIEKLTEDNTDFRRVLYSSPHQQLVLMALRPGEEIGSEIHKDTDQFLRIEKGVGEMEIDGVTHPVKSGSCVIVPAGARHNLTSTGKKRLRLYTIYSPPHHQDQLVQATKAEADSAKESFDGTPTESKADAPAPKGRKPSRGKKDSNEPATTDFVTTRSGMRFGIRSAVPDDDAALKEFFSHVTRNDLRFRFFTGMTEIGPRQLEALTHPDHEHTESFVAFNEDGSMLIASGMLACDEKLERGEVAIAIREDHKHNGVSWELLAYIARVAEAMGLNTLESIESRYNHEAIELERDMGFVAMDYPGDATLILLRRTLNVPADA